MRAALLITLFLLVCSPCFAQSVEPPVFPPQNNSAQQSPPGGPPAAAFTGDWIRDLDLGKLVGRAAAPVNLIIAASIAISFQIGKQGMLFEKYRLILEKYEKQADGHTKSDKLFHQLGIYARRLRLINWSCRALAVTIAVFIGTVMLTSFGVTFPHVAWVKIATGLSLVAGLLSMFLGFIMELTDNSMEAKSIDLEMEKEQTTRDAPH